jgi:uncharacterized membrane protein
MFYVERFRKSLGFHLYVLLVSLPISIFVAWLTARTVWWTQERAGRNLARWLTALTGSTLGVIAGGLAGVIFYCAESEWRRNYSGLRLLAHHVVFFGLYGLILGLTTGICMGRRFEDADTTTVRVVDEPTMNDERMERM